MRIIWLDLRQKRGKIIYRSLILLVVLFIFPILKWTGLFGLVDGILGKIPFYVKPLMGLLKDANLLEYSNWILFVAMFIEVYFVYISIMDSWRFKNESMEKGRFLIFGNQIYKRVEWILVSYFSVCIRFFIIWIPYKIILGIFCKDYIEVIPGILSGMGIYMAIIACGLLISILFNERKVFYDSFFMILIALLFIGNIYKLFSVIKFKSASMGNVPSELLLDFENKFEKLHNYSVISYLNPINKSSIFNGISIFVMGIILAAILIGIGIELNKKKDY